MSDIQRWGVSESSKVEFEPSEDGAWIDSDSHDEVVGKLAEVVQAVRDWRESRRSLLSRKAADNTLLAALQRYEGET